MKLNAVTLLLIICTSSFFCNVNATNYYYMVTGKDAKCTTDIGIRSDCTDATRNTGYCTGPNGVGYDGVELENSPTLPKCSCSDLKGEVATFNKQTSLLSDCTGRKCLCWSTKKNYYVTSGARCDDTNFIQTEADCLSYAKSSSDVCGVGVRSQTFVKTYDGANKASMPYGCYCHNSKVYFNRNVTAIKNTCKNAAACLCRVNTGNGLGFCDKKNSNGTIRVETGTEGCRCCFNQKCADDETCKKLAEQIALAGTIISIVCCLCCCLGIFVCVRASSQRSTPMPKVYRVPNGQPPRQPAQQMVVQQPIVHHPQMVMGQQQQPQMVTGQQQPQIVMGQPVQPVVVQALPMTNQQKRV
jgi:hypothetical protein